ncbi:hypothetical protein [Companilactobacillus bobalius]|uniref:Uncharacterized protein n=2 Tax=Companilactobacillus bobalius TaxID=2801451 RepID=A0A202FEE9_9LACO|nr:hypothetical protein [Companilactobacillus bobalius]KAE9557143.1 hypothetical protein ATN92_17935 [Companilactobacillus bobalius]KRK82070.1 hypothetical protein FC78_GL000372 [Companilactobacillus bobalius DSM 19674]OVE98808.1 hypothetical protein LKACC16343_00970 [Companilactobacillus bobalius]GEO57982.1 hypothetical protein LBO01_11110 [Companilactobacillus paralimentarius]
MKKKLIILTILSAVSAGSFFAVRKLNHFMKDKAVKQDRKKLESLVDKYLHGNEKLLEFVGTLSDSQVRELVEILDSIQKQRDQLKLKSPAIPEYLEKKVTQLLN